MKNYSIDLFLKKLKLIKFPKYSEFMDINAACSHFIHVITSIIDKIAPLKEIRIRNNTEEWMDEEFLEGIRIRDKLLSKFKRTKSHIDHVNFKKSRNNVLSLIRKKKKTCVVGKLNENVGKPKELWKSLKSLGLPSKQDKPSKICLKKDGEHCFDDKINSNIFKDFFSNLAKELVNKLPNPPCKFGAESIKRYYKHFNLGKQKFTLHHATEESVLKLLEGINPTKAAGLDNLAGKFLKDGAQILAKPVSELCNLSISLSLFPEDCKQAKLKPLFKKGSRDEPKNYRPISLLPQISKVIEKIVHEQVLEYLDTNKILYRYQSGFRPHHSTDTCLSYLSDKITQAFEKGMFTGMILIDLQKAFDTIDHEIFLEKLKHLAFSDPAIYWFRSYLTSRTFFVNIGKETSSPGELSCGVPQGSILGPLIFLLYVNDMPQAVDCDLLLYADDSCLVFRDNNINEIEKQLNKNFNSLCDWFVDNKLSIHFGEDKTKSILFGRKNKRSGSKELDIRRGDIKIKQYTSVTYLGCVLDENLSGESMAARTLSKINGRLRFLYRKQNFLDFSLRRLLANALIQPHFDYACSAWFPMLTKRLTKKIQTAQNKCIRFCLNLNNRAHVGIKEFKDINWLPTKERFEQCTATNVFKFFNNSAPSYMSEMFSPVGQGRITRRSKNKLNLPFRKTNMGQNGLSYIGPKIWNSLQSDLKSSNNVNSFKHKIKDKFFNDLQKRENSPYIYY